MCLVFAWWFSCFMCCCCCLFVRLCLLVFVFVWWAGVLGWGFVGFFVCGFLCFLGFVSVVCLVVGWVFVEGGWGFLVLLLVYWFLFGVFGVPFVLVVLVFGGCCLAFSFGLFCVFLVGFW